MMFLGQHINDLKSKKIEAKHTTGAGTKEIAWVTDAFPMPSKDKQSSGCARTPEYMDGAIWYRVCGGGLASEAVSWTYESITPTNRVAIGRSL